MQKGDYLSTLLRSNKSVFTVKDIALLWQEADTGTSRVRLNYYVKKGSLYHLRRGLYAKSKEYNQLELATRIFTPSYISFETVLTKEGLIFQYQKTITMASYLTREINIKNQLYSFKKIKDSVLINNAGVVNEGQTSVATKERAFLDTLYLNSNYHFDNLRSIDWDKIHDLQPIYNNQRMTKVVNKLFKDNL